MLLAVLSRSLCIVGGSMVYWSMKLYRYCLVLFILFGCCLL